MAQILVTGVNGFVGGHLAARLHEDGHEVIGLGQHPESDPSLRSLLSAYVACDLTDEAAVSSLPLRAIDAVINLAGLAKVGDSFTQAERYKSVNVRVLSVLGQQLLKVNPRTRMVAISTGAVYDPRQPLPLTEQSRLIEQGSPYAESKILMEQAAEELREKGLNCIVVRPFNHSGPGQAPGFLIPDLYSQILQAPQHDHTLKVGNLQSRRDYTDVRDIVRAYAALALSPNLKTTLYNVCSGTSRSGTEILDIMLEVTGNTDNIQVEVDQSLLRPTDPPDLYGSHEPLTTDTGWEPTLSLRQTISDFISSQGG
jgi:GDP-4-dehydro-6-deoxy-D-mannose reductase